MNFNESLEYLYGLGYELSVKKFGLENTFKLLGTLGDPEKSYLKVQVAGTNGKGSVCAFLEAICLAAGISVGKYTSPHLVSITERIRIDGEDISEREFADRATRIRRVSEKLVEAGELAALPTFFEQVTANALTAFAENKVEIAILETGLGGRFDATTAARAEIVAVTLVDYDHQNILGNTLVEIAAEKAAVIRADTDVVLAAQPQEALDVILQRCADSGVTPKSAVDVETDLRSQISDFKTAGFEYKNVRLNLLGKHQLENARVAILLAETLREKGFPISTEHIIEGLQTANHKGRLEFYQNILFDGAHNISGAKALREYLDEFIRQPITLVFGAMKEKDLTEIGPLLFPKATRLILTKPDNPRSMQIADLAKFVSGNFPQDDLFLTETVAEALKLAKEISTENDLILVTGSLYLVGEAQKIMKFEV